MSFRTVVIEKSAKLDFSMGFLVVRQMETTRIHLSEISLLVIESTATSLTTALLTELMKAKVKVVFCDEKRQPSSELLPYYGCHDCSGKLRTQIAWNQGIKELVWSEIVSEKIRKQKEHLELYGIPQAILLEDYLREVTIGDKTNREGHAAKEYFTGLFGEGFSRGKDCGINAALNYGYGILLSMFNREIVGNGYLTQIGIFHNNADNPFNLGSDLMEPFRIVVDIIVKRMMPEKFEHDEKEAILSMVKREVVIDGRREFLPNAIKIFTRSVFGAINNNDVSEMKFCEQYEL